MPFSIVQDEWIEEIGCRYIELIHPCGMRVIKLANKDPENTAGILFRTLPPTSNGVAHILEHSVLCGSKDYPVKDPFFSILRRSLASFANAFTGIDFTCYPFSAYIEEDFYNLFSVYLDAVFHPLLEKKSFLQEGWRLTKEGYKGIVLNEMTQARSDLHDRIFEGMLREVFSNSYGNNAGGIPSEIIKLTHPELIKFHEFYYAPQKAIIFLYGDLNLEKQLEFIESTLNLASCPKTPPLPPLVFEPRIERPKDVTIPYPAKSNDDKTHASIAFLLPSNKDPIELLALSLLDILLTGNDSAPLCRALLDAKAASQVESHFETDIFEPYYLLVFKETKEPKAAIDLAFSTLSKLAETGFTPEEIDSAFHQLSFSKLDLNERGYPVGLTLFLRVILQANHDADLIKELKTKSLLQTLKKSLNNPSFLKKLINDCFLNNSHCIKGAIVPDAELLEKEKLAIPAFTEEELLKMQTTEDLLIKKEEELVKDNCLPILNIQNIPQDPLVYPVVKKELNGWIIYEHQCPCNGIVYADLFLELPPFSEEDLFYLKILTNLLTEIGTKTKSFQERLLELDLWTGEFNASIADLGHQLYLRLNGKALNQYFDQLITLFYEALTDLRFDEIGRIEELLKAEIDSFRTAIPRMGTRFAILRACSHLNAESKLIEGLQGVSYLHKLQTFFNQFQQDPTRAIEPIINVYSKILDNPSRSFVASADFSIDALGLLSQLAPSSKKEVFLLDPTFISKAKKGEAIPFEALCYPLGANENTLVCQAPFYDDPASPYLTIASRLMSHLILHPMIREMNGAYGASTFYDPDLGLFGFYSSSDPNVEESYKIFLLAVDEMLQKQFSDDELYEAKLSALQRISAPVSLSRRASFTFSLEKGGKTLEKRKIYRKQLIEATKEDIIEAIRIYIAPSLQGGQKVTIASNSIIDDIKNRHNHLTYMEI